MSIELQRVARRDYMRNYYATNNRYRLRVVLAHMIKRCDDPENLSYSAYGERGITVCNAWKESLDAFVQWAESSGYASGLQIDRIDNDGGYSPENCRWVTAKQNNRHRRNNKLDEEKVRCIRQMIAEGFTNKQIAAEFSVHSSLISNIHRNKAWA